MNKRTFLSTGLAFSAMGTRAFSASYEEAIVAQLTQQGFAQIVVETTWLGRVRILATRPDGLREIILNPRTGEILRDLWTAAEGQTAYALVDPVGSKGASSASSTDAKESVANPSGDVGQTVTSGGGSDPADNGDDPPEDRPETQQ
jgi:hypothetical protein